MGYEAPVNFRSIHEIRSLGFKGERLDEEFYPENYENKNIFNIISMLSRECIEKDLSDKIKNKL